MKKLILLITILAIAATSYAGYGYWTLISQQQSGNGVICTYEKDGNTKSLFRHHTDYCPFNL